MPTTISKIPQLPEFKIPRPSSALIRTIALTIFFVIIAWTSYYTVGAESEGVVLRFGRFLKTVEPGLHFKIPMGVDSVTVLPTRRQLKLEFGFYTPGYTNSNQVGQSQDEEKSMVTGDLNAALVEWVVQYRIADPKQYLFDVRNPGQTLRDISEAAMREVIGDRTVDEVITIGRQEIEIAALARMQDLAERYQIGIRVDQVQLKNVNPPSQVQASFNEVNKAQQDRENTINIANGEYNKAVPKAKGEAEQTVQSAEGYRLKRVNYNPEVLSRIYQRMISERAQIAQMFRSEGEGEAARIAGQRERDLNEIQSKAYLKVQTIRGEADAKATEIYARAYTQNPQAAEFYAFLKSMETYRKIFARDSTLVLSTDSDLFSLLKRASKPKPVPATPAQ